MREAEEKRKKEIMSGALWIEIVMFVEQYIDSMGQSRSTPFHSTLDDDYLLALELQREFDKQAEERNASGELIREQGNKLMKCHFQ